jgi:hypothetical protein
MSLPPPQLILGKSEPPPGSLTLVYLWIYFRQEAIKHEL